jgi:3-oxoacyl-[acyl-carrier protein] reductase
MAEDLSGQMAGRVAIVTGASSGIGAATAGLLAARGCNVAVAYRENRDGAAEVVERCIAAGADAVALAGDVAEDADCRALAQATIERWGRIDALVNSAGYTRFVAAHDLEALGADDFMRSFAVNVVGVYQMTRAARPHMVDAGGGAVVNVSSQAGATGTGSSIAYAAAKGAVNTMTLSLARVLAPEIRVNCVAPGLTDTRWNRDGLGDEVYEKVLAKYRENVPLRRAAEAPQIADAIVWLIAGAEMVTGQILTVDSGMHLGFAPLLAR